MNYETILKMLSNMHCFPQNDVQLNLHLNLLFTQRLF